MMYSESTAAFISLHTDNTVSLYQPDGRQPLSPACSAPVPFMGLTSTKLPGRLVGWGPGPILTLLDCELSPLAVAPEPLDIHVCQAVEQSTELVTAGAGNVCVWSVMHLRCKVKILEGLNHSVFTRMALAPPRSDRPHRAFAVCGRVVTVVDLNAGKVLEHKKNLCLRDITALVYCSQLDCLIIASKDLSIRVWGPDWDLRMTFVGHNGVVNSMLYCSESGMLLSASMDCTVRCWNVEEGDEVQCVNTQEDNPPLYMGVKGVSYFSFSHQGVDFWTISSLYTLHCKLGGDAGVPLRQILVPPFPAPYPARALCVSGDSDVTLVAAETGAVLTSFRAKQRILCADYCLHKEILLALTEAGTVLQANTLTNPVTLMEEWRGRGLGPWQQEDYVTGYEANILPSPGPASCLVLYSYVAESQRALEEWRSLQEERGHSHRNKAALDDTKNKFLVILGQSGGCVSVLKLGNGKVRYRTPAHDGQRVTTMQADPENSYLLTTGEDKTVLVWRVDPYAQECLSLHLSLYCGQPLVHLAVLGLQLALGLQEPHSATYSLMLFNLLNRSQTDHLSGEDHSDGFTGLCVCPELRVFVSSSLDGTVRIWDEENCLIRTLQLSAEPECLSYSGLGGDLLLGIRGDLYRMNCARLLPHEYQQRLLCTLNSDPVPDLPIIQIKAKSRKQKTASTAITPQGSKSITGTASDPLFSEDMWRQKEYESVLAQDKDLASLLQGTVKCKRRKPPRTEQTQKEAFDRYMKMIYGTPPKIKIGLEDVFDSEVLLFSPIPHNDRPCTPPVLAEDFFPEPALAGSVTLETRKSQVKDSKENQQEPAPAECNAVDFKSKSALIAEPWLDVAADQTVPEEPFRVKGHLSWKDEEPPKPLPPRKQPKTKTAPSPPRTPTPVPPWTPTPEMPAYLKQFAEEGWFMDMYPDQRCIPSTLSPEDFSLQLLGYLTFCSAPSKIRVLAALQALHRQGLLHNTDKLFKGLIDSVPKYVRPNMSPEERSLISEMLNHLVYLKSDSNDLAIKLLTLLAYKKLGLRKTVLCMLTAIGVHEAEQWLQPELESWDSELQDQSDIWKRLHERADYWLEFWTSKYKEHGRCLYLKSTAQWKPFTFTIVDVLNYFCSIRKEEYTKAQHVAPEGRKDTVLLSQSDCGSQPIHRLGESHSMTRIRRPPGIILPPLRNRPFLMCFTNFITLPLPRVSLGPFPVRSDQICLKTSPRRYFVLEQSYVEYYR